MLGEGERMASGGGGRGSKGGNGSGDGSVDKGKAAALFRC